MNIVTLALWRDELTSELAAAERELAAATGAVSAAEAELEDARETRRAGLDLARDLRRPIPASLVRRLDPGAGELRRAEGAVTRARAIAENVAHQIADIAAGLAEVDRLEAEAAAEAEAPQVVA